MKILPDFIPSDSAPLQEADIPEPVLLPPDYIKDLNGKNVYVELNDGRFFVGKLEIAKSNQANFFVGTNLLSNEYVNIKSFREV